MSFPVIYVCPASLIWHIRRNYCLLSWNYKWKNVWKMPWGTLSIQLEIDQWWHSAFQKEASNALFKHNWLGTFGPEYHCFLIAHISAKVLSFKMIFIHRKYIYKDIFDREWSLWPSSTLPNVEYSHYLHAL